MKATPGIADTPEQGRGHGEKLSRREAAAIVALLAHPTIPEAAKAAGVSETTLWRWLQRDDFRKKYREAQDKVFDGALGSLQGASTEAVDCLKRNLTSGTPSAEVQAAKVILEYTIKARELFGLDERIRQLEAALKDREEAEAAAR
jgi:transposase